MEPDTQEPDPSTRLRLVDVRVSEGRNLRLGAQLTGILTGTATRAGAAHWIATTVAGPRPDGSDGSIDIGGRLVSAQSLPSPLLAPGSPVVIDRAVVRAQWRVANARVRDELAAAHASYRFERYRIEAALERARSRPVPTAEPVAPAPAPEPVVDDPTDELAPLRAQLRSLLAALDASPADPLPEGSLLADAWDAHGALVRARGVVDSLPAGDIELLERRVNAAREAVAMTTGGVPDEVRVHIEQCHHAVVEAEAELFGAKRKQRSRAIARYEHAVALELVALADAGIDSYASFLVAVAGGESATDLTARLAAQTELAAARTAFDSVLQVPDVPTRAELQEREEQMRARATELLGRAPGADPAGELRALRVETEERSLLLDQIAGGLRSAEIEVGASIESSAREFLAPPAQSDPSAASSGPARAGVVAAPDVQELEQQRFAHDRALDEIEAKLAHIDATFDTDVGALEAADLRDALDSVLTAYRNGHILRGQLPIVIDGVLDGVAAAAREAAVQLLAGAADLQTVVVTDDPEVMQSIAHAGGVLVRWPETVGRTYESVRLEPSRSR